jgi:C-terminal processing protease CtpA/Prc
MFRTIQTLLACVLLALCATCSAAAAEPAAMAGSTVLPAAAVRADFEALYAGLQAGHYDLYAHRPRADYEALYRRMRSDIDGPMPPLEAWRRFQRFVAYGNVAHARIEPPATAWEAFRQGGGKAFPLLLRVVDGKVLVAGDRGGVAGIATGDEVVSIAGKPALEWLRPARALVSADTDQLAHAQLEAQLPVLAWLSGEDAPSWTVVLRKGDGRPLEIIVPARDRAGFEAAAARHAKTFELDWNVRDARVLENGTAYLRPGPFYDNRAEATDPWDATAFQAFLDDAFKKFIDTRARRLVIDLRDNPGGDNSFSDRMLAWFADRPFRFCKRFQIKVSDAAVAANRRRADAQSGSDSISLNLAAAYSGRKPGEHVDFPIPWVSPREGPRFTGDVYVLVNRHSYSNSVLVAATVQDFGFGTVLGEETADLASTYGALEKFTLPNTGLEVSFPKARILRPNGDTASRGVVPDTAITSPLAGSGRDLVLEQALALISSGRHRRATPDRD